MLRGSQGITAEAALRRHPGVHRVEANPVSQTATVTYDSAVTSVADLRRWVHECGYHCAGQSVPDYVCDPLAGRTSRAKPRASTATRARWRCVLPRR